MNCCTASHHVHAAGTTRMATDANRVPSPRVRRSITLTRWSLPAVILVLLPKCPACLAAYIALGTGVSLTVTASAHLRIVLIFISAAAIVLNVLWLVRRNRRQPHNHLCRK
jgi:hypothetical protein